MGSTWMPNLNQMRMFFRQKRPSGPTILTRIKLRRTVSLAKQMQERDLNRFG